MYNEQLEALISAALADGVLTEKKKQILFKRAGSMGIDLDEFEMVLDARLVELKKKEANESKQYELKIENANAAQKSAPKSNKFGDVRKCPSCGAMIESFQSKCPDCGYEFTNIEANSTAQKLMQALDAVEAQTSQGVTQGVIGGALSIYGLDPTTRRKVQIIQSFPIPNTKEDIIEFLTLSHVNSKLGMHDFIKLLNFGKSESKAWKQKEKQLIAKADILLKNDADYLALKESWKKKKKWGLF